MKTRMEDRGWRMATPARGARAILHPLSSILVSILVATGCSTAGVLTHKLRGPPPVPAQYTPKQEPMLVLVENYRNPSATIADAQRLEDLIKEQLAQYK